MTSAIFFCIYFISRILHEYTQYRIILKFVRGTPLEPMGFLGPEANGFYPLPAPLHVNCWTVLTFAALCSIVGTRFTAGECYEPCDQMHRRDAATLILGGTHPHR